MQATTTLRRIGAKPIFLFAGLVIACGGDNDGPSASGGDGDGPVYALQTMVFNPDESVTSYVTLSDSTDISEVSLEGAREFASYAFVTTLGGKLLVSDGESPIITRYAIDAELGWQEERSVSFANTGVTGGGAGFERHWFLDESVAYLTLEVTKRVVWDPSELEIVGVEEESALPLTLDGLELDATFNRPPQLLEGPVLKPFYYRDGDWFRFGPSTPIAVYDPETHAEREILDVPCPALEVASQDEAGNTYFSPWTYGPALSLFGEGPALCIRRVGPDSQLDTAWAPDLTEWTGGRPVMVFRYVRDGKAIGTVLHVDEVEADFSAGYDPDVATELDDHWRLWIFDLENETAAPIDGIGAVGSGFNWANLDGRTYVFLPDAEWSETQVFEIDLEGNATRRFSAPGAVNNWIRVR